MFCVAFLTLIERKILGFGQNRCGPNKSRWGGSLQPVSDAIKLFCKSVRINKNSNWFIYIVAPGFIFFCYLLIFIFHPHEISIEFLIIRIIIFTVILCVTVFPLFLIGWASNRKYAAIGSIRSIAQVVSYEVSLSLLNMILIIRFLTIKIKDFSRFRGIFRNPLSYLILWVVTILAESNRRPFDTAEGESELVSGFNIEYSSGGFVLIFLAEYLSILVLSCVSVHCVLGININSLLGIAIRGFIIIIIILIRGSLPRLRYDTLIKFAWTNILPLTLLIFYFRVIIDFLL